MRDFEAESVRLRQGQGSFHETEASQDGGSLRQKQG